MSDYPIHDSLFDIKDDAGTKLEGSGHYRVHPDVYRERCRDLEDLRRFQGMVIRFTQKLNTIRALVDEQAEDSELWRLPVDCEQADLLQGALRQMHALIEDQHV